MSLDGSPARPGNEDNSINKLIQRKHCFIAFSGTRAFCGQVTGNGIYSGRPALQPSAQAELV